MIGIGVSTAFSPPEKRNKLLREFHGGLLKCDESTNSFEQEINVTAARSCECNIEAFAVA
jgi:hypothetical protein